MLLLAACLRTTPSYAQDVVDDQDAQLWVQVNAQVPVTRTWAVVLEGQPRWSQNFTHYDQIVLRVGTTVRLTPVIQIGAAYALVPRRTVLGALVEHQSYQQVVVTLPRMGRWSPQFRLREDQRVLDQWGDAAHRVREQFRVTHPVPKAPAWTIVLHEESFYNLDRTVRGPSPGWDQFRFYSGVQRAVSRHLAIEVGYMWQEVFRLGTRPHRRNHNAMIQVQYRPRRSDTPGLLPGPVAPAAAPPA